MGNGEALRSASSRGSKTAPDALTTEMRSP